MYKTFILVTQEAEKLGAKHLPFFFWDTLYLETEIVPIPSDPPPYRQLVNI